MFDDLRNSEQPIFEGEQINRAEPVLSALNRPAARKKKSKKILGMTAVQRFILSTLLFLMVCIVGTAVLFITGKIALPL